MGLAETWPGHFWTTFGHFWTTLGLARFWVSGQARRGRALATRLVARLGAAGEVAPGQVSSTWCVASFSETGYTPGAGFFWKNSDIGSTFERVLPVLKKSLFDMSEVSDEKGHQKALLRSFKMTSFRGARFRSQKGVSEND